METVAEFDTIPFMTVRVNASELEQLAALPEVVSFEEDVPIPATLASTVPLIGADKAWLNGYSGAGQTVAILDTGVDLDHPAFTTGSNRIVAEGCYSTTDAGYSAQSVCPGGVAASTASGSGSDCVAAAAGYPSAQSSCTHGTHVAGIAAGNDGTAVGVAKDANIIAVQIFSLFTSPSYCGGASSCALTFTSDQIAGLERVYALRDSFSIASVNMSLGGSTPYGSACDSDSRKAIIDNLRSVGIATIIASGNNGFKDGISKPACISSAISVGSSDDSDNVSSFSNVAPILDLMAPGSSIYAAIPDNSYGTKSGTSMATPHVVGAWAIYKEAVPNATVADILSAFQLSGILIDDDRSGGIETDLTRIHVDQAIGSYIPGLTINKEASHSYSLPGDTLSYTLSVMNNTAVVATNVIITDIIPSNLTLNPASLSGDASITGVLAGDEIRWTTGQSLAPNESLTRTFVGTINPGLVSGGQIANTAYVSSTTMAETRLDTAVTTISAIADCNFSDGFESGSLSAYWMMEATEDGRITITNELPHSGTYALLLDDAVSGGAYSEASAILNVDLTGQAEVELSFNWYDLADEYDAAYDGVFIRENSADSWIKVYDFDGTNSDSYQNATLDLKQEALNNGLSLSDSFQIKFGFYDNYPALFSNISGGDGFAIDNVTLSCVPAGLTLTETVNDMSLDPGQLITYTIVVANNDPINATNAIISSTIPHGLNFAGPVILYGTSGTVAVDGSDLPIIASGLTIPAFGQITATVPLTADFGVMGGTSLDVLFHAKSDNHPQWVSDSQAVMMMNAPPVAQAETVTTSLNTPLAILPLLNDFDANGDSLLITAVSNPDQGGVATVVGLSVNYTPKNGFGGVETFTYTVSDGVGGTAVGQIFVTVPNVPPVAHDDATNSAPNVPVYYPVLINDTDPNSDDLTIVGLSSPANGSVSFVGDMVVYTSTVGFDGTAVLSYTISDSNGGQDVGQLSITVAEGLNGAPIAQADAPSVDRDEAIQLAVLENDMDPNLDPISLFSVSSPAFGTAVMDGNEIYYTPAPSFVGVDSFEYTIQDTMGSLATTAVTVSVALENTEIFNVDPNATQIQTLSSSDNKMTLSIPIGALPNTTQQIAYTILNSTAQRAMNQGIGVSFALNVGDGAQIFMGSPTFDPPLEITIKYEPSELPAGVAEHNLKLFYFDGTLNQWQEIEIVARDLVNNTVTASLPHFTDFSLGASYSIFLPMIQNE